MSTARKIRKILIAEDDAIARKEIASFLVRLGYNIVEAERGDTALEIIRREIIDVVLSDIRMPGLTGIELLKESRKEKKPPVFIIITAYGDCQSYYEFLKMGALEYLNKPVELEEIRKLLKTVEENQV